MSYTCGTIIHDLHRNGSPEKKILYTAMVGETPRPFCIAHPPLTRKSRPHSKTGTLFSPPSRLISSAAQISGLDHVYPMRSQNGALRFLNNSNGKCSETATTRAGDSREQIMSMLHRYAVDGVKETPTSFLLHTPRFVLFQPPYPTRNPRNYYNEDTRCHTALITPARLKIQPHYHRIMQPSLYT